MESALDRRDFSIYRTTDGRALAILPETEFGHQAS